MVSRNSVGYKIENGKAAVLADILEAMDALEKAPPNDPSSPTESA